MFVFMKGSKKFMYACVDVCGEGGIRVGVCGGLGGGECAFV